MRIALTLVMVCGCMASSQQARVDRVIANYPALNRTITARQSLTPEWRVGQWAVYKAYVDNVWMIQGLRVAAKDDCGIWIEASTFSAAGSDLWLVCLRDDPALSGADRLRTAIGTVDGKPVTFHFEHGKSPGVSAEMIAGFLDAVTLNAYPEDAPREDVLVTGGHFTQALRLDDGKDVRWIHPDVPFNGTIKRQRSGADERVLLGFGETTDSSTVAHLARLLVAAQNPSRPSLFIGLHLGPGYVTTSGESNRGTTLVGWTAGRSLTKQLDLLVETTMATLDEPGQDSPLVSFLAGLRWSPFGRAGFSRIGASALYVRAGVGYAGRRDSTTTTTTNGIGLDAALGWAGVQGHDFTLSVELGDQFATVDGGRNYLSFGVAVDVFLPRFLPNDL